VTDGRDLDGADQRPQTYSVNPTVDHLAAYAWRVLLIATVAVAALWLLGRLQLVVLPVVAALFLTRALVPVAGALRRLGLRPALAAAAALVLFVAVLAFAGRLIVPAMVDEFRDLPATLSRSVDDVEKWLVNDSSLDVDRADLEHFRREAGQAIGDALRNNSGTLVSGAVVLANLAVGVVLALVLTFFFLKEGGRLHDAAVRLLPSRNRDLARRMSERAWATLGGFLRGAALLGLVEAAVIGLTLFLCGGSLVIPVMVLTFIGAFVPFVGAIVAGAIAVLVALATASPTGALVVGVVALLVQQLDNDLLAPLIYGRALQLHPLVVLLAIVAGGALFGLTGSFLAVPVTAVTLNVTREARQKPRADEDT
jgi:predicted PurR-regulated permease PerM